MATHSIPVNTERDDEQSAEMTLHQAVNILSREEKFMATVYAMNTLLIQKGVYSGEEFDALFVSWAKTQLKRKKSDRPGF